MTHDNTSPPTLRFTRDAASVTFIAERIDGFPVITITDGTMSILDGDDLAALGLWAVDALDNV
jgi:hypothetical protein